MTLANPVEDDVDGEMREENIPRYYKSVGMF